MKIQKGYVIAIILYIIICIIFHNIEVGLSNKIDNTSSNLKNTQKELTIVKEEVKQVKQLLDTKDYIKLKNGDDEQNKVVAYLWEKTHNIDIILTFYGESWLKTSTINNNKLKDGTIWSKDYGYCQLNDKYHNNFIKSNNFKNMSSQLNYCIEVYNKAIKSGRIKTTFYAYNSRYSKRVRGQFVISQEAVNITYNK